MKNSLKSKNFSSKPTSNSKRSHTADKKTSSEKNLEKVDWSGLGDKKDSELTLEDLKPRDRQGGYPLNTPKWYQRAVEIIPGLITWFFLLLPIISALLGFPQVVIYYISFLAIYWTYRGFRFVYGVLVGFLRMKRDLATDWVEKLESLPNKRDFNYVLICPLVKEGLDVLEPAFENWAHQDIDAKKISVVFALEEKFKDVSLPNTEVIIKKYGHYFKEVMTFLHPNNIEGEVQGVKGANINWATRHFVREVQKRGENIEDYLLITNDSDFRPDLKYLSAVTYKYLNVENPKQKFFTSAVYKLTNNLWDVPLFVRTQSSFLTLVLLHSWVVDRKKKDTFSAYIVNLETVARVGYWDPAVGIDDTTFYWNAKIRFAGDFYGEEVYVPVSNDAVQNKTTLLTYRSLYKQQHRWGAGVIAFPIAMSGLRDKARFDIYTRLKLVTELIDTHVFFLTLVYLLTFALPIMSLLSPNYRYSAASILLPKFMSSLFTLLFALNIPIYLVKRAILKPPKHWSIFRIFLDLMETFLITVNMLTLTFIPYIQAQTELMLGKGLKKEYYATEKVRSS
ncbi:MAG: hypothetical protein Fur003_1630 [Candidatus Dojkabacteria bacterium]